MTAKQEGLYLYEWGRARKWYRDHGFDPKQADNKRHALHKQALGTDKSSKDFTNPDLDKVLAAFRAVSEGDNLDAQLRQLDQPEVRRTELIKKCQEAAWEMYNQGDSRLAHSKTRDGYIAGCARNVIGKALADCTYTELGIILGCLLRRVGVMKGKTKEAMLAAQAALEPKVNPF